MVVSCLTLPFLPPLPNIHSNLTPPHMLLRMPQETRPQASVADMGLLSEEFVTQDTSQLHCCALTHHLTSSPISKKNIPLKPAKSPKSILRLCRIGTSVSPRSGSSNMVNCTVFLCPWMMCRREMASFCYPIFTFITTILPCLLFLAAPSQTQTHKTQHLQLQSKGGAGCAGVGWLL